MENMNGESNSLRESPDRSTNGDSQSPSQTADTSKLASNKRATWKLVVLLVLVAGGSWLGIFLATPYEYDHAPIEPIRKAQIEQAATKPKSIESQLIGTWRDHYHGQRTLTLRADGTGTMVCELAGLEATLFAKKLTFQEAWYIEDGQLVMKVTGGEPKSKIDFVLKLKGDTTSQKIIELTEDRLRVHDKVEKQDFNWQRITEDPETTD